MAVTDVQHGFNTTTTVVLVCIGDVNGETLTVTCNGETFTGVVDTSVYYGSVKITITGLSAGTRYDYSVVGSSGAAITGSCKTKKTSGQDVIVVASCFDKHNIQILGKLFESGLDPDVLILNGDCGYFDGNGKTENGVTTVPTKASIANSQNAENMFKHHVQMRRYPNIKRAMRNYPCRYMADDHEWGFDDACNDLTAYRAGVTGAGAATAGDLALCWAAMLAGSRMGGLINPTNTDSPIDATALYFRESFLHTEFFFTDCIQHRSNPADADGPGKKMLGDTQRAWLADKITNSTKTFKLWVSGKQFWKGGNNSDTYAYLGPGNPGFQNELALTLQGCVPANKGLLVAAGDQHLPNDQYVPANYMGGTHQDISCLVCCPSGVDLNDTAPATPAAEVVWSGYTAPGGTTADKDYTVLGVFIADENKIERYLFTSDRGLVPMGYIEAGSNNVQHKRVRM